MKKITERKAQLARFAYFTIPVTAMAAGWMAGVEFSKIMIGRQNENAWLVGAAVPGGVMGIWKRNVFKGVRTGMILGAMGYIYQYSTNNNLDNHWLAPIENPNIPTPINPFNRDYSLWNLNFREEQASKIHENMGFHQKDAGPNWKKWDDQKSE